MTPRYNTKHGRGTRFDEAVSATNPHPFVTNGAVSGRENPYEVGQLDAERIVRFRADRPTFAVYSYATPIAWRASDGSWVMPNERYSSSTSCHQSVTRSMLRGVTVESI